MNASPPASADYSILSAFEGPIARPRPRVFYQISLVLVALTMVVLPAIYLALVAGAGYGVYYHAVHHWKPIMEFGGLHSGRAEILKLMVYVIPLFVGAVVVFFMLKPLLARQPMHAQPLALNPVDNPVLYAFIEKICETVGAPSPKRIDLNCELNASASFRRGFFSLMSNDLVLTIGLPLVANLNAREFGGVVAHEFGHFTQSVGMRLSYFIRSVIVWFGRVAYERDAWDVALETWSAEAEDARVAVVVWTAQLGVWFSRLILRLLMLIGVFICGFLLRQMEYDADAYQIKVVGSETFETTHRKLATLSAALEQTFKKIGAKWELSHCLPDNLSELLRQSHEQLPANVLQKIDDTLGLERTGFFDTHPSAADRIRQARRAGEPGIFHDDRPAADLFANFDYPARFVTLLHYTDDLGIPITEEMLVHVESTRPRAAGAQATQASDAVCDQYFLGILPLLLPLQLPAPAPSANYESDAAELEQLRVGLQNVASQLAPIASQFADASNKLIQARAAMSLIQAHHPIQPNDFGLAAVTTVAASAAETKALATRESLRHSVHEIAAALNRRLQLALALKLADRGESGGEPVAVEQINELVASLNQAANQYVRRFETLEAIAVLDAILALKDAGGETPTLSRAITAQTQIVNSFIGSETTAPESQAKPGLQLAKRQSHVNTNDIQKLRQQTRQWFASYHSSLEELSQIVLSMEGVAV